MSWSRFTNRKWANKSIHFLTSIQIINETMETYLKQLLFSHLTLDSWVNNYNCKIFFFLQFLENLFFSIFGNILIGSSAADDLSIGEMTFERVSFPFKPRTKVLTKVKKPKTWNWTYFVKAVKFVSLNSFEIKQLLDFQIIFCSIQLFEVSTEENLRLQILLEDLIIMK